MKSGLSPLEIVTRQPGPFKRKLASCLLTLQPWITSRPSWILPPLPKVFIKPWFRVGVYLQLERLRN